MKGKYDGVSCAVTSFHSLHRTVMDILEMSIQTVPSIVHHVTWLTKALRGQYSIRRAAPLNAMKAR
jgi:hypothetical protein